MFKKRIRTFLKELSIVANFDWRHRRQKQGKTDKNVFKNVLIFLIASVGLVARWSGFHAKGPGSVPGWLIFFWLELGLVGIHFRKLLKKLLKADITLLDAKNLHHIS